MVFPDQVCSANNITIFGPCQFNDNFRAYNQTKKRYRLAKGSAGSGKSVNTAQDYIIKLGDPNYKP
jgi:phage terminase large subunit